MSSRRPNSNSNNRKVTATTFAEKNTSHSFTGDFSKYGKKKLLYHCSQYHSNTRRRQAPSNLKHKTMQERRQLTTLSWSTNEQTTHFLDALFIIFKTSRIFVIFFARETTPSSFSSPALSIRATHTLTKLYLSESTMGKRGGKTKHRYSSSSASQWPSSS